MKKVLEFLKGKKTYIIAGLMALASLVHLLSGDIGLAEFVASEHFNTLLEGFIDIVLVLTDSS